MFSPARFFMALILPLIFTHSAFACYKRVTEEDSSMKIADYSVANDPKISLQIPRPFEHLDPKSKDALNQLEIAYHGFYSPSKIRELRFKDVFYSRFRESLVGHPLLGEKPLCIQIVQKPKERLVKNGSPATLTSWYNAHTGCIEWYVQKSRFPLDERRDKELNLQIAFAILHRIYGNDFPSSDSKIWYDNFSMNTKRVGQIALDEDVVYFKALARVLAFAIADRSWHLEERDLKNAIFFSPVSLSREEKFNKIYKNDDGTYAILTPDVSRRQALGNEILAIEAVDELFKTEVYSLGNERDKLNYGGVIQVGHDMDLFEAALLARPRNFRELAQAVEAIRPATGNWGREWYARFFEGDELRENRYRDRIYNKPCRIVPANDPMVAFLERQSAMAKQSKIDAFSKIVSDQNLATEVLWLRDHQEKSMAEFDAFSYSGYKFVDAKRLADELFKSPYFLKLQKDDAQASREASKIHGKLERENNGWAYQFWANSIIKGEDSFNTIKEIEEMMSFGKSFDYDHLSSLALPERISEYKGILNSHQKMASMLNWSPPRFKVLVELYNLCKDHH